MSKIIPLSDYKMSDTEKFEYGMDKLDEALSYFDDMSSFAGKNLSGLVYIAIRYGENLNEKEVDDN